MGHQLVTIVIPVFNKWKLTAACLRSIAEHTPQALYRVTIVDNASSDATATELPLLGEQLFSERFQLISFDENRNFAPASNAGARSASSEFLLFLNNDTIVHPGWLPPLLQALQDDDTLGAVGPLLLYDDGTIQHMGVAVGADGIFHLYAGFPADHPVVFRQRNLQALTGAALLIRKDFFWECGGFHEEYRNGFEDVELSWRIRQRGKQLRCIPQSVVTHLESQTPGRSNGRSKYETHNSILLTERCGNHFYIDLHYHGLLDGFSPVINEFGGLSLLTSEEESAQLLSQVRHATIPELYELTQKNPLWIQGLILVANNLDQQGFFLESLVFWIKAIQVVPCKNIFRQALSVARRADVPDTFDAIKQDFVNHMRCSSFSIKKAFMTQALKRAKEHNDKYLVHLYQEALNKLEAANKEL